MAGRRPISRSLLVAAVVVALGVLIFAQLAGGQAGADPVPGWKPTLVNQSISASAWWGHAHIDGDHVVYLDASSTVLTVYNISLGWSKQISVSCSGVVSLCFDGRYVAWIENHPDHIDRVMIYDIGVSGPPLQIGSVSSPIFDDFSDICLSGDRVVWKGTATQDRGNFDLYVFDIVANAVLPLSLNASSIETPDLDGDRLVWVQGDGGQKDVMLYEFDSKSLLNLSGTRGPNLADYDPQISGGSVVWVGEDGSDCEVFLYRAGPGIVYQLTNDSRNYRYSRPLIDGGSVTWAFENLWMVADANTTNPAVTVRTISGDGEAGITHHALGGGWAVCVRGDRSVWRYDLGTAGLAQASDVFGPPNARCYTAQTNGDKILLNVDLVGVYLLEETPGGTTTTTAPPSTTTTTLPGGLTFTDVPTSHPYHDAIEGIAAAGVINGYDDGSFRPDNRVWRQHFAKMIVGTVGFPCSEADVCSFSDVDKGGASTLYPDNYIAVAASFGITNGLGGGRFGPYNDITRAQVITMVVRAAENYLGALKTPDAAYYSAGGGLWRSFADPTHGYNAQLAEFNGLLTGVKGSGDVITWIWQPATRGEVAQILWNLCNAGPAG